MCIILPFWNLFANKGEHKLGVREKLIGYCIIQAFRDISFSNMSNYRGFITELKGKLHRGKGLDWDRQTIHMVQIQSTVWICLFAYLFYLNTAMPIHLCTGYGHCFTTEAKVDSCHKDPISRKASNIFYLPSCRKKFTGPGFKE